MINEAISQKALEYLNGKKGSSENTRSHQSKGLRIPEWGGKGSSENAHKADLGFTVPIKDV